MVRSPSSGNEFLVQDMAGNLFKLDAKKRSSEKIISFHSGAITGADLSPLHRCLATLGEDGTLRLHNYSEKTVFSRTKYGAAGSSLTYLPQVSIQKKRVD